MSSRLLLPIVLPLLLAAAGCNGMGEAQNGSDDRGESPVVATVNGYASQPARIYVDEEGEDWADLPFHYADTEDDGDDVDLERLRAAHSSQYLFLQLEVGRPINLQEGNTLTLYVDTDNDPTTGERTLGIGAEVSWSFGDRSGRVHRGGSSQEIGHADLGFSSLPTVRADTFELALNRSAEPGGGPLFTGDSLRIAVSNGGDRLPDNDGGIGYVLSETNIDLGSPTLDRPEPEAVRVLSYNVRRDGLFESEIHPNYRRILHAVGPDVVAFQEIYEHTADETEQVTEGSLGIPEAWNWAKTGEDLVLGAHFPILDTHLVSETDSSSGAFYLDAQSVLGRRMVAVVMHPPCCNEPGDNAQRQEVVDGVAAFMREVKNGEGPFGVESETPVVIVGDMNFVGDAQQPQTLRTGDIVNTDQFGPSAPPDWDASALLDTKPRQTATPLHATWIDPESSFPPGRLDYAYVTDSVLEVVHEYVLYTPALSEAERDAYDLQVNDTDEASDHLPLVIDVTRR